MIDKFDTFEYFLETYVNDDQVESFQRLRRVAQAHAAKDDIAKLFITTKFDELYSYLGGNSKND